MTFLVGICSPEWHILLAFCIIFDLKSQLVDQRMKRRTLLNLDAVESGNSDWVHSVNT